MIKRPIKYHFKKGKVKYDMDQYEDGTGWGPTGMYPRKKPLKKGIQCIRLA